MNTGKVSESVLKRSVFKQLKVKRKEILAGPRIGMDCSIGQFEADELFSVSSDPITGAVKDIGSLAVHVTANDIAASGAEPVGITLTILLPDGFFEEDLKKICGDVNTACEELNVTVMGGHTEITTAVNQPIICVTGIGKLNKNKYKANEKAKSGQDIIMTKWAGLEGTAIIATEKEEELKNHFNSSFVDSAIALKKYISVVPESKIAVEYGVSIMHDVTEGGVFGGLWELAANARKGAEIILDKIPIKQETIEICEYYELNPYKLISSGSMLMIADDGEGLVKELEEKGIPSAIIGKLTDGNDRVVIQEDTKRALEPANSDELYKIIN